MLFPEAVIDGIEINPKAAAEAQKVIGDRGTIYCESILDTDRKGYDFVFTCGVLIHINPDALPQVYAKMYSATDKYLCVNEYYNPKPVSIRYHNEENLLFKRDFAGEILDKFSDLQLINYGFIYHKANIFTADDETFFLMQKKCC